MTTKDQAFLLGLLASLISIGAGLYMLTSSSAAADSTVFDVLMHGIGAYCVARGVWMLHELRAAGPVPEGAKTRLIGKSYRLDRGNPDS
jgi:hypothetical protein